jgi:hypothetical protein
MLTAPNKPRIGRLVAAVLVVASGLWLLIAFRFIAVPFYVGLILLVVAPRHSYSRRSALVTWLLFLCATASPIDMSLRSVPGPPRAVPYVTGLPGAELREQAANGEVVLGGCVVSGFEPRWVFVW